jgi:uncharacterized protein
MVIDFRVRPPFKSFARLTIFGSRLEVANRPANWVGAMAESVKQRSMPLFIRELEEADVSHAVVWGRVVADRKASTTLDDVAEVVGEYPDLLSGFGGIGIPDKETAGSAVHQVEDALVKFKFKGITVEPGFAMTETKGPADPNLYPVYERCQELGGILALTISIRAGTDMRFSNPVLVDRVAADFPRLKIVIGHSCWPWVAQAVGLAYRRSNVYLLPDFYALGCSGYQQWVEAANTLLPKQIIFGSAYPLAAVGPMVDGYRKLGFKDEVLERVMSRNAAELLGRPV